MANKPVETIVKFKVDKPSVDATVKASAQVKAAVASVGGDFKSTAQAAKSSAAEIGNAMRNDVATAVKSASSEVDALNAKLDTVRTKKNVLSTVGREIRALPAMPIPGTGLSTDVVGKFMDILGKVPPVMNLAASATATLTPLLGASAAGFVGVGVALATVAAPLIAVGLAIKSFTDLVAAQAAALDWAKSKLQADTQQRIDNAVAIKTASAESIKAQLDEQRIKLEIIKQDKASREIQLSDLRRQYDELGAAFDPAQRAALGQAGQVWQAEIDRLTQAEQELSASIQNTTDNILPEVEAREREEAAIKRTEDALKAREQAESRITGLLDQRLRAEEQASVQSAQLAQDRALRNTREQEDFDRQREDTLKKHIANIEQIDADGQVRLAEIRQQGNERLAGIDSQIADTNSKLTEVAKKLAQDRAKVETDAAAARAKAAAKAQADEARALQEYNKRKLDIQRSFNSAALDAEANNDVTALIQAQRARDEELRQNDEQYTDAKAQRAAALAEELAQIEAQKQQRLADLQAQAEERRAALQEELTERQAQRAQLAAEIAAQVADEKKAIEERKRAAQAAITEQIASEDAARKLRLQRQAEDDRTADQRRAYALQQQIADIAKKVAEESRAAGIVAQAWVNAAIGAAAAARNALLGAASGGQGVSGYSAGGGSKSRVAFADGGIVRKPTIALMGERPGYEELIVPFRKSDGLPGGLGQQVTVNFSPSIVVGDVASMAEVRTTVEAYGNELALQITRGLGAARMGA